MQNFMPVFNARLPGILSTICRSYHGETYYDILRVKTDCSDKEIRQAFVDMSKKFHPDVGGRDTDPQLTSRFVKISEAYQTLSKPKLRSAYDQRLWAQGIRAPDVSASTEIHRPWEIVPDKSQNPGPYYGIDGVGRLSNLKIAIALLFVGFVGSIIGFASVKYSFMLGSEKLDEKSAKAGAYHASVRADAEKFGNEEQLRRMLNKMLREDR